MKLTSLLSSTNSLICHFFLIFSKKLVLWYVLRAISCWLHCLSAPGYRSHALGRVRLGWPRCSLVYCHSSWDMLCLGGTVLLLQFCFLTFLWRKLMSPLTGLDFNEQVQNGEKKALCCCSLLVFTFHNDYFLSFSCLYLRIIQGWDDNEKYVILIMS